VSASIYYFIPKQVYGPITFYLRSLLVARSKIHSPNAKNFIFTIRHAVSPNSSAAAKSRSHLTLFYVPLMRRGIVCTQQAYDNYADRINEYELRKQVFTAAAVTNVVFLIMTPCS
jgi:hypothetical protein